MSEESYDILMRDFGLPAIEVTNVGAAAVAEASEYVLIPIVQVLNW